MIVKYTDDSLFQIIDIGLLEKVAGGEIAAPDLDHDSAVVLTSTNTVCATNLPCVQINNVCASNLVCDRGSH